ncbi:3-keto-5-aminohexanoate cleavage protein [Pseudonocardia sp. D17]|uniref:3-keto-5-aminohexanoate cleavage protein n=1 Tax=Pseudonocardia sp. D17 TaxID=882661 RepID=UPI002B3942B9|nr:3-keto-5-aminohexanoate cleavage protein [Pseudonocardia sp. D17]
MTATMTDSPLFIEVRCNESTMRGANPHLPYSTEEIVREAVRAHDAGAAIIHWHGRDPDTGGPDNSVETYRAASEGIRGATDLITKPTLGYISQTGVEDRVKHLRALADDPWLRFDAAAVDFGSLNIDTWDGQRFTPGDGVYVNSRNDIEAVLRILDDIDTYLTTVVWDIGQIRTAKCFREMGLAQAPTFWELVFTGDSRPSGAGTNLLALQAMVAELPPGEPWQLMCYGGDVLPLAAAAIVLGGHVAIGLGDHDYARFGTPHNGELVAKVVALAETIGRPVATPAQARELLGMRPLPARPGAAALSHP